MDGYKFLKPKFENAIIRDPVSRTPLDKNGELKPFIGSEGTFWRRRVAEGSCIIFDNAKTEEVKTEIIFDEKNNLKRRDK